MKSLDSDVPALKCVLGHRPHVFIVRHWWLILPKLVALGGMAWAWKLWML